MKAGDCLMQFACLDFGVAMNIGERRSDCLQRKRRRAERILIEIQRNRSDIATRLFERLRLIALSQLADVGRHELTEVAHLRFRRDSVEPWASSPVRPRANPAAAFSFSTSPVLSRRNSPGATSKLSGP